MSAIGMVEVFGLVKAITVADECLKTSNVNLIGIEKVSSGILTVKIIGDVGAVTSAIESVENYEQLIATSVIPNLDESALNFFKDDSNNIFKKSFKKKQDSNLENKTDKQDETKVPETEEIKLEEQLEEKSDNEDNLDYDLDDNLEKKTVKELIQIITKTKKMTYKEAKKLKKEQLIKIIRN